MAALGIGGGRGALGLGGGRLFALSTTALSTPATGGDAGGGAAPVALAPLDITTRFLVGATRAGLPLHYVESFGPGEVPAGHYVYGVTASGAPVPVQMSAVASWPDGSTKTAKLALTIPGDHVKGQTKTVRFRTSVGPRDRAPCMTLAQLAARTDFRLRFYGHDFGAEEYELRLNDLIAAGVGRFAANGSGTHYPTAGIDILGQGAETLDLVAEAFVRREGDGAIHRTYKALLYVTYHRGADGFQVLPSIVQDTSYGGLPDAVATAGPAQPERIAGIVELYDGATLLHAWGGPNDWRAVDVPASAFDAATGLLTYPVGARMGFTWAKGVPFGFAPGAGALPSGISANDVFYPGYHSTDQSKGPLWRFRASVSGDGGQAKAAAFAPNKAYALYDTVSCNGAYYVCRAAGTSGASAAGPTGNGASLTDGSTESATRWENLTPHFGTAGSGTVRMYPLVHSFFGSGADLWTREARRVWVGAGDQPWAQVGLDFAHALRVTRHLPPMDYEAAAGAARMTGAPLDFELHMVYRNVIWKIEGTGDGINENRIGPMVYASARALLHWDDPVAHREMLVFAGSWGDFQNRFRDERSGGPIITTRGPADNGTTYPGHAPCNTTIHISNKGCLNNYTAFVFGSPGFAKGTGPGVPGWAALRNLGRNDSGYVYEYNDLGGAAHLPNAWQVPYILTGDAAYLRLGEATAHIQACQTGWRGPAMSPNSLSVVPGDSYTPVFVGQPRGMAWAFREFTNLEMLVPDDHPNRPFYRDVISQNLKFYRANAERGTLRNLGIVYWTPNNTLDVGGRPYHNSMWYYIFSLMHWRYRETAWGADLDVIMDVFDRYMIDMYNEDAFPGVLYFHSEYGVSRINNTGAGAFDVRDTKNVKGRGTNVHLQSHAEMWEVNYGVPPADPPPPTPPNIPNTNIVYYKRTSLAGLDGNLPVQYQIATGALGMRGIMQPRARPLIAKLNARVGNAAVPVVAGGNLCPQWSCLPLDL